MSKVSGDDRNGPSPINGNNELRVNGDNWVLVTDDDGGMVVMATESPTIGRWWIDGNQQLEKGAEVVEQQRTVLR
ncbi:hypothetical protein GUJ93_ZPchr0001g31063 [Zizania palustris]|uniref:Uncharacterized protein n=1 Tax=Zizania palustris TaxID=103762 RepID=A0A8J5RMC9_ZIZPA|nr:hypothetical protein GUJ93_ZPchr0001g31063 [Zizania palustris]